jgi:hypothetical protein
MWAFWTFIVVMLLWQFYLYNQKLSAPDPAHPDRAHFFFYMPSKAAGTKGVPGAHDGPYVEQTAFSVSDNTPTSGSFTCHVTLKNTGKAKAIDVEVRVRPFRGTSLNDVEDDKGETPPMDDNSPMAQFGQYVAFPDLAPGESSTQDAVFIKQPGGNYGKNPSPEIIYAPEKK